MEKRSARHHVGNFEDNYLAVVNLLERRRRSGAGLGHKAQPGPPRPIRSGIAFWSRIGRKEQLDLASGVLAQIDLERTAISVRRNVAWVERCLEQRPDRIPV